MKFFDQNGYAAECHTCNSDVNPGVVIGIVIKIDLPPEDADIKLREYFYCKHHAPFNFRFPLSRKRSNQNVEYHRVTASVFVQGTIWELTGIRE